MQRGIRWYDKRESKKPVGLGTVNEGEGFDGLQKEREERCPIAVSETETSDV